MFAVETVACVDTAVPGLWLSKSLSCGNAGLCRCDDGKDPEKRAWIHSKGSNYVYVSGRTRAKGEMNGKSGNVNNVCHQLYPPGEPIPGNEVLCIFDADQVSLRSNLYAPAITLLLQAVNLVKNIQGKFECLS